MELRITGQNIEIPANIHKYIERKLERINRHLPGIRDARLDITEEQTKSPSQRILIKLSLEHAGNPLFSEERGSDIRTAIDLIADKMDTQVQRYKSRLYDKGRGASFARSTDREPDESSLEQTIVKTKLFTLEPMALEEALSKMEILGHQFFVFLNSASNEVNVVYRRRDDSYGLIKTRQETFPK